MFESCRPDHNLRQKALIIQGLLFSTTEYWNIRIALCFRSSKISVGVKGAVNPLAAVHLDHEVNLLEGRPHTAAGAQEGYGLGTPATDEQIAGWHIDVLPDGNGLPPGSGTVMQGKQVYQAQCLACHGADLKGVAFWPALAGGQHSLGTDKPKKTVGSYWPYATTLYDYIHRAMPFTAPQSLSADEVYSVTAYVLHMNGILDENASLDEKSLPKVKMPNRDGLYVDDRPDTQNTRCMTDCLKKNQK